ncbi:MAG: PQQ-binding-like beta-propeller repeat protein [Planctomycetes bacterium]|nr:PQQ-binding-like beta-propeller repeat protein [Planctomycetota bacterium]
MGFRGDLSTINLADLFQTLSSSRKVGTLVVTDGESRKCIYFGTEGVRLLSTGKRRGLHLGEMLVRSGKITQAELQDALAIQKKLGLLLGEVFQKVGLVTKEEVAAAIRLQIEEELYDLFSWTNANFEFQENALPPAELLSPDQPVIFAVFDSNALVMEAARRLDEWEVINKAIPDHKAIYVPAVPPEQLPAPQAGADSSLLPLINGARTVEQLIVESHASKFEACSKLYRLCQQGLVKPAKPEDLRQAAQNHWNAGQHELAASVLAAATDLAPEDPTVRQPLAQMLKYLGKWQEAALHYNLLGEAYLRTGSMNHAFVAYQAALECHPTNLESRRGLFEIHVKQDNRDRALGEAKVLVPALMAERSWDRARAIAQEAIRLAPDNLEMRVHLANVLDELGDKATSQVQLKQALDNLPQHATQDLTSLYERILTIDPTRKDLLARLDRYIQERRSKVTLRRRRTASVGVLGGLFVLSLAWLLYEWRAGTRLEALRLEARPLEAAHAWDEARAVYRRVSDGYPFTRAARLAGRALSDIDYFQSRQRQEDEEVERRLRDRYGQLLNQGAALEEEDAEGALKLYREVLAWAAGPGVNSHELKERAQRRIDGVNKSFREAEALALEAQAAEEAGRYAEARDRLRKLFAGYKRAPAARDLTLPLRVETIPPGARVYKDGTLAGESPLTLRLRPGKACEVRAEARGFLPFTRTVREADPATLSVVLEKTFLWQFSADGALVTRPLLAKSRLVFGSRDRVLYALDRLSGSVRWKFAAEASGDFLSSAAPAGERVVAGSNDGHLYGVNLADGTLAWKYTVGRFVKSSPALTSDGRLAVVGGCDGKVHAVHVASGESVWTFATAGPVLSSPAVLGEVVVVGSDDGSLYGLEAGTGKKLWALKLGAPVRGGVAMEGGCAFVGCDDGRVSCVNASGTPLWQFRSRAEVVGTPVVSGGSVYFGSRDGGIYAVDRANGLLRWRFDAGHPVVGGGAFSKTKVYFGTEGGVFLCLEADSGQLRWKLPVKAAVRSTPAVGDGVVYFGTDEGRLYAIA